MVFGDFLALVGAFVGAYILRVKVDTRPLIDTIPARTYLEIFLYLLPFWVLIFALIGLYSNDLSRRRFREIGLLLMGSFLGLLFVIGYDFVIQEPIFPARLVPVYGFGFAFTFLVIFRTLARRLRYWAFRNGYGLTRALVIGSGKLTDTLLQDLNNAAGYNVVALVGDKRSLNKYKLPVYPKAEDALSSLDPHSIDEIIQTELYPDQALNDRILSFAQVNHIDYRFTPSSSELLAGNVEVGLMNSFLPVVKVNPTPLLGWGRIAKRVFDMVASSILLLLCAPVLVVVYLCIKLSDYGAPAVFRQTRLSRYGKEIYIYKFRSHLAAYSGLSPEEAFIKMGKPGLYRTYRSKGDQLDHDPRISKIGQFIRKTSLDELPQLINVLRGDLSLVGPRALVPEELNVYPQKHLILSVKSGITGLAQVSGRGDIGFEKRRRLDVYYVRSWTFTGDLIILLKTLRIVLSGKGARK